MIHMMLGLPLDLFCNYDGDNDGNNNGDDSNSNGHSNYDDATSSMVLLLSCH